ncbi:hypothetical protein FKV75_01820 [Weissella paramesenteroides]|uniref:hypothetical protein n=2 Tax=Weissella paramesenteroides TaxID=1249 RepID=UPI001238D91A|nr:hypothetical protein [Weissella paramesenteroides]KAA8439030.1 hypothetical protein FKV81_08075 [Weissella paramesenteroides]KAA8440262.1 hypothetical protein FKV77_09380 [Weissella paramesenteroides]KAA8443827.1 hypothetical protein FKV75_01820 [Weissella paramesenteroides]KAA8448947.1 hypothetical protein FKV76_00365 [Weissella paramesenteroides]KAA8451378.1 hypothetical protein FKV74_01820 [Weissella paramesenteroides]
MMIKIYLAPTVKPRFALLVDESRELVSQVYPIQVHTFPSELRQIKSSDMMALHTKQTQLLANNNYWLWPIDESTNHFPLNTQQHVKN